MRGNIVIYMIVMAGVTYLLRMLPLVLVKRGIKNTFVKSFLAYVPYACLAAMTFPGILESTSSVISAIVGFIVAIVLALFEQKMIIVALSASAAVLIVEMIIRHI